MVIQLQTFTIVIRMKIRRHFHRTAFFANAVAVQDAPFSSDVAVTIPTTLPSGMTIRTLPVCATVFWGFIISVFYVSTAIYKNKIKVFRKWIPNACCHRVLTNANCTYPLDNKLFQSIHRIISSDSRTVQTGISWWLLEVLVLRNSNGRISRIHWDDCWIRLHLSFCNPHTELQKQTNI